MICQDYTNPCHNEQIYDQARNAKFVCFALIHLRKPRVTIQFPPLLDRNICQAKIAQVQ